MAQVLRRGRDADDAKIRAASDASGRITGSALGVNRRRSGSSRNWIECGSSYHFTADFSPATEPVPQSPRGPS